MNDFQADWKFEFNKKNTRHADFFTEEPECKRCRKLRVEMMSRTITGIRYAASTDLKAKIIQLPFQSTDVSFYALLPDTTLREFEKSLTAKTWQIIFDEIEGKRVFTKDETKVLVSDFIYFHIDKHVNFYI